MAQNLSDVAADAKKLEKVGYDFLFNSTESATAEAFHRELLDIVGNSQDYARKVFNQVKEDMGSDNWFSASADGADSNEVCFKPAKLNFTDNIFICGMSYGFSGGLDGNGKMFSDIDGTLLD